ncbi:MAG: aldo/keto reductase [Chloroflexi bacterium]|nr:aldo/keto reductase [Chloroflexota bacterium]
MEYRTLGRTGLRVSALGMGGLFISSRSAARDEARLAVRRALELGVTYFDTAPGYYDSEQVLGEALEAVREPYILSTKLGGRPQPFDPRDKDALRRSVEESLRNLHRDSLDLLLIHEPDRPGQYDWFTDPERFTGPVTELLAALKEEGLVRYTGLGGTTAYELPHIIATRAYDVVLTAFNYSALWREAAREVLPAAQEQGMGIVIGSPLQQGALARRYDQEVQSGARWLSSPRREQFKRFYALLDDLKCPAAELAIRFVLSSPSVSTVLMGARSASEVELNVAAAEAGPLEADVLARLDEIAAMVPFRPYEEPAVLPFGRPGRIGPGPLR